MDDGIAFEAVFVAVMIDFALQQFGVDSFYATSYLIFGFLIKVDLAFGRNPKRKCRLTVEIADGDVAELNDVHSDKGIESVEFCFVNTNVDDTHTVWKKNIDEIKRDSG